MLQHYTRTVIIFQNVQLYTSEILPCWIKHVPFCDKAQCSSSAESDHVAINFILDDRHVTRTATTPPGATSREI